MIFKEGKVLIGKRRKTTSHGVGEYSFTGGHMEFNESFEKSIKRETMEESGINIKNIRFSCIVNIAMYNVVLIGLIADWEKGEPRSLPEENIGGWEWYDLGNFPSPLFYPTEILIDSYKTGRNYYDEVSLMNR